MGWPAHRLLVRGGGVIKLVSELVLRKPVLLSIVVFVDPILHY